MRPAGFWQVDADQNRERPRADAAGNPAQRFLPILKELRDDLRLIIDSTTSEQYGEAMLGDLIASQRHRFTGLFETQGTQCMWQLSGLEQYALPARRMLT
ncbi:protein of unknown function (plasmid) [Caballeronia sp. S22]